MIDLKDLTTIEKRIVQYGTILTNDESAIIGWSDGRPYVKYYIRILTIEYEGDIYYHKYGGGELLEFKLLSC